MLPNLSPKSHRPTFRGLPSLPIPLTCAKLRLLVSLPAELSAGAGPRVSDTKAQENEQGWGNGGRKKRGRDCGHWHQPRKVNKGRNTEKPEAGRPDTRDQREQKRTPVCAEATSRGRLGPAVGAGAEPAPPVRTGVTEAPPPHCPASDVPVCSSPRPVPATAKDLPLPL